MMRATIVTHRDPMRQRRIAASASTLRSVEFTETGRGSCGLVVPSCIANPMPGLMCARHQAPPQERKSDAEA
jgi:hypothetical protein